MSADRPFGGQSMSSPLRRVLLISPEAAGWGDAARSRQWKELGFSHAPDPVLALRQHDALRDILSGAGAEVEDLREAASLTMDAVYAHDPTFMTDRGVVGLRMGKPARDQEPAVHLAWFARAGIPVLGEIRPPGVVESGDLIWLDEKRLLAGRSYRTNEEGIAQLRRLLSPDVEVISAPVPHGGGPGVCLHLMSLMSVLDERVALVDPEMLAVETVELLRRLEFDLIPIDPGERETQAANVLSLGARRLAAIAENTATNSLLGQAGFDVRAFPGGEICQNGKGGPTCLTRAILRR